MSTLLQALLNGTVAGAILTLPTIAFSLMYGTLGFPNAALAGFVVLGAYVGLLPNLLLGLPYYLAALVTGAVLAPLGVMAGRIIFRQFYGGDTLAPLVASVGLFMVIENMIRVIWGNQTRGLDMVLHRPWLLGPVRLNPDQLIVFLFALSLTALCFIFLKYTSTGRKIRAVSDDQVLAGIRGINAPRVIAVVWMIACGLCGVAGVLLAADSSISPLLGWSIAIPVFAAALLGGIGSPVGAFFGAMILGIASELSTLVIPPTYKSGIAFIVMVVLLLVRPQGLFRVKL